MNDEPPEESVEQDSDGEDALERFLEMPPEHGVGDDADSESEAALSRAVDSRSIRQKLNDFLFNKKPSEYSSIAPRDASGKRTKPFFFNGGGLGR